MTALNARLFALLPNAILSALLLNPLALLFVRRLNVIGNVKSPLCALSLSVSFNARDQNVKLTQLALLDLIHLLNAAHALTSRT